MVDIRGVFKPFTTWLSQNLGGLKSLSPTFIIFLINFWMLTNAPGLFGESATRVRWIIMMYQLMLIGGVAMAPERPGILAGSIFDITNFFWIFFVSTLFFGFTTLLPFSDIFRFQVFTVTGGLGSILIQAFTVSYSEEFFFRGVLEEVTGSKIIPNVLFGPWHAYTYGGDIARMAIASAMGFTFSLVKAKFTLLGSMGAHTAWNLRAMGELEKFIRV